MVKCYSEQAAESLAIDMALVWAQYLRRLLVSRNSHPTRMVGCVPYEISGVRE